ncbi:MAG: DUF6184 family natural product biosynthesis lipoprotein [Polyangiaceae bacterium]
MVTDRRSSHSPRGAAGAGTARIAILTVALITGIGCARGETVTPNEPAAGGDAMRTFGAVSSYRPAPPAVPRAQESDAVIVERLSQARCRREDWCRNVGDGQAFASQEVCLDTMRGGFGNDINQYKCPQGINGVRLERCALAIQREQCDEPLDTITRMDKCRSASLCVQ